jgi:hypothetical protein
MPRPSFTLRDVFWLTLVVGLGVGWWARERSLLHAHQARVADIERDVTALCGAMDELLPGGWATDVNANDEVYFKVMPPYPPLKEIAKIIQHFCHDHAERVGPP